MQKTELHYLKQMWFYLHLASLILAWNGTKSAPLNVYYPKLQFPTYTWFSHAQSSYLYTNCEEHFLGPKDPVTYKCQMLPNYQDFSNDISSVPRLNVTINEQVNDGKQTNFKYTIPKLWVCKDLYLCHAGAL